MTFRDPKVQVFFEILSILIAVSILFASSPLPVLAATSQPETPRQIFSPNQQTPLQPPQITSTPVTTASVGQLYTYDVEADNPNAGETITFSLEFGPSGMSIDPVTGLVTWTPSPSQTGNFFVEVVAEVQEGFHDLQDFTIIVGDDPPLPPQITSVPITTATVGQQYIYDVEFVDPNIGETITFSFEVAPAGMTIDPVTGLITWTPSTSQEGTHFVEVVAEDNEGLLDFQPFDIVVSPATGNTPPTANDDTYVTDEDTPLNVPASGVLINDTDPENDPLTAALVNDVSNGTLTLNADGSFTYTPDANFNGSDNFTYQANDGQLSSNIATVTITVNPVNDPPIAVDDFYFTGEDTPLVIPTPGILSNDSDIENDPLTAVLVNDISNGTLSLNADGSFTYTPSANFSGTDTFDYIANDGQDDSNAAIVTITVNALPDVDLFIRDVDKSNLTFDGQAMTVSGDVSAIVTNIGPDDLSDPFEVLFFEDTNLNQTYDPGTDSALGSTTVTTPINLGQDLTVTATLSGTVLFSGTLIWGFVDSNNDISETDETNNLADCGRNCFFTPTVGVIDPVLEWSWTSSAIQPNALNVMMTPGVIDVNGDDVPDVVFGATASTGGGTVESGYLRALNGEDGTEIFTVNDASMLVNTATSVAVGDIDGDNLPEIIAGDNSGVRLIAFENDGTFKWRSPNLESILWGGPSIADIDNDGTPEIIIGRQVVNNDGTVRWTGTGGRAAPSNTGPLSAVADINMDGNPDVVAGNTVYNNDGTIQWQNTSVPDGYPAVGNFDADVFPEIVVVVGGTVRLLEHDGTIKWGPVSIPGGGVGGPPTIADYDNDNEVEIGIAGATRYAVFETDGTLKWAAVTQDGSSNRTGSSVFDFDGDGSAEVVYRDELRLRIYRGTDGFTLFETPLSSCTWHEYVLVADVDADGNAEIVAVANNNCGFGPQRGVFVYGSQTDSWVPTRQIWNQHTYHITNINDDGTIPTSEANNWESFNNYRQNTLNAFGGPGGPAPDLVPSYVSVATTATDATITVRVGNGGAILVGPGIDVAFYDGDPNAGGVLLGSTQTTQRLDPGEFEDISITIPTTAVADIWVLADATNRENECDEVNNVYQSGVAIAPAQVNVPDVVGLAQADAEADIIAAGLVVGNVTTANSNTIPAGDVISQDPAAGTLANQNSAVDFVVSLGPAQAIVPDVVGLAQADAEAAITGAGLTVGGVNTANSNTVPAGDVISQNPTAGTSVVLGSSVDITVSLGPAQATVPDVVGLAQADAENAIVAANLTVGAVGTANSNTVPAGDVISQNPIAGTSVNPNSAVDLVVSLGPAQATVPDVVGLAQATAEADIIAAGLTVGNVTTANSDTVPAGDVISQDPAARASVNQGSAVNIVVSLGPVQIFVPDVTGLAQATAESAITGAGLAVGSVTFANDNTVLVGNVISQNPTGGTPVASGTPVDLVVSLGTGTPILQSIAITPANPSAEVGIDVQLTATGTFSDTSTQNLTTDVAWDSSALSVANVTPAGLAVTLDTGSTNVSATLDGITGNATLTVSPPPVVDIMINPGDTEILEGQNFQFTANLIFADGTSAPGTTWDSSDTNVATIDSNTGFATAGIPGQTTISATEGGVTRNVTLTVNALVAGDTTPPTVAFTSPANNAQIGQITDIIGTANDETSLLNYTLDIAVVGSNSFTTITSGSTPVINGVLGQFDPTTLLNDFYTVRLTAQDEGGNVASVTRVLQAGSNQKVGNFSMSFQDLTVPMAGLPITVTRTYDSRDRSSGDFGFGWKLDVDTMSVNANRVQGTGWEQFSTAGFPFPTYHLAATDDHIISITLPDGRVEEFEMTLSPTSQVLFPFTLLTPVSVIYNPKPGTQGTLIPLGFNQAIVNGPTNGPVQLLEDDFTLSTVYDPQAFQYTSQDGRVFIIDKTDGVQQITEPNGNTLSFTSGGILHSGGKSVLFTRDGQGRITSITDPNGNVQTYTYNGNGDLVSHTDPEGNISRFKYNFNHGLLDIIDPRGVRPSRNEYDADGRLIAVTDANGNRVEFDNNVGADQQIIRDRLGNITVYNYDSDGNVLSETDALGNTKSFTYDTRGNTLTDSDALGNTTTFTYDANDNKLSETDALGNTTTFTYNTRGQALTVTDAQGNVQTNTYDANGNLLSTTDPEGNATSYVYDGSGNATTITDALGNATTYAYDASGNITQETDPLGNITTYTYDLNGNLLTQTNSRTDEFGATVNMTTTREYDGKNRIVREIDAEGNETRFEYNAIGNRSATIDKNGNRTEFEYDLMGNLTVRRFPDGTTETFTYDANGNQLSSTDRAGSTTTFAYDVLSRLTLTTFADGSTATNEYDAVGRAIATINQRGNRTEYEFDEAGRNTKITDAQGNETNFTYSTATAFDSEDNGELESMTDANGNTTTFEYDTNHNRTRTNYPDGTFTALVYDAKGRVTSETDQAGNTTTFEYDPLGRLTKVIDALGGETTHTYDEVGNRITQTDANGNATTFAYDKLGRPISRTLPLGMSETFTYDANGNMLTNTDFNGDTTTFEYDSDNRETRKIFADNSDVVTTYTTTGKRATVTDSRGTTSYAYDILDRQTMVINPDGSSISYAYDTTGNRTSLTTPSGTTTFTYDDLDRLETVTDPNSNVTSYTYDDVGNRASITAPNGVVTTYTYDTLNRLTNLDNVKSDGTTVISSYAYTLGPAGNRTRVVEDSGRTVDYTYDALYRLTQEDITDGIIGNETISYTYDSVGNRLSKSDSSGVVIYSYDDNDRLLSTSLETYTYDDNGNTLTKTDASDTTTYTYDFENRLATSQNTNGTVSFAYDADGNRVSSTAGGLTTRYLVDTNRDFAQVIEERTGAGALIVSYTYGDDLISQNRSSVDTFYQYDGLGSTRALTDSSENVADTYVYDAFGIMLGGTGTTVNNYLYTGEQFDPNIGFYYLRARYYSQDIGRFITMDTFPGSPFDPITLHKYLYANADPVNNVDPSGNFGLIGIVIVAIIIGILAGLLTYFLTDSVSLAIIVGLSAFLLAFIALGGIGAALAALSGGGAAGAGAAGGGAAVTAPRFLNPATWQQAERFLSQVLNVAKNTRGFFVNGMSRTRIPDFVSPGRFIADSKFVQTLTSSAQIRDFVTLAQSMNVPLYIYVRQGTHITGPVLRLIQSTGGNVIRIFQ